MGAKESEEETCALAPFKQMSTENFSVKTTACIPTRMQAEILDLPADLMEIVALLPPGIYERSRLCDQLNSSLAAHGWGSLYGTVE